MTKLLAIFILIFAAYLSLETVISHADVAESQKPEVEHLLQFVETSNCVFERNGKKYDSKKAAKHIRRKYKHFRDQITTTEEFIEYSGTKSTRSGEDYIIYCSNNAPIKSSVWLLEELKLHRQTNLD
ncbi:MAG: DUF5329 family protein [Thermodesulfobacteriota bacterium]